MDIEYVSLWFQHRSSCIKNVQIVPGPNVMCVLQSRPVESAGTQVLVLGLDGAGKTSLLHCLATGSLEQDMQPTQGFNAVSINREDLHIEFLESKAELLFTREPAVIFCFESVVSLSSESVSQSSVCLSVGGKEELRPYWQKYMSKALVLVFVVDSSKPTLFALAKRHLHELLASDPRLPLMVLANKQVSVTEKHSTLVSTKDFGPFCPRRPLPSL